MDMSAFCCISVSPRKVAIAACSARFSGALANHGRRTVCIVSLGELAAAVIVDVFARFQWEKFVLICGVFSAYSTPAAC